MYSGISEKIASWCCDLESNKDTDYEVVVYGWSVIIENVIKILILFGFGILFQQLKETLIILTAFCVVRIHAGGIHAKSTFGCTIFMIMVVLVGIKINEYINPSVIFYLLLSGICNTLILLYAPNGCESCENLSEQEKREKKWWAIGTTNALFLVSHILKVQNLVFVSITMEALSLLLFQIQRRKGHEKERTMD